MIGQYLLNTNESATVSISQKILELNKALGKTTEESNNKTTKIRSNYKMEQQNKLHYMDAFYISYILKLVIALSGDDVDNLR